MVPKRTGRPRRDPLPGERVPLGLRVTPQMKKMLEAAADASGRSQSQEAEHRLEMAFRDAPLEAMLSEILERLPPKRIVRRRRGSA